MAAAFFKESLFAKMLAFIIIASFIFGSGPVVVYAHGRDKLRPKAGVSIAKLAIEALADIYKQKGSPALTARLADLVLDKVTDPAEKAFLKDKIAVFQREGKSYFVCLIDNGWRIDLSTPEIKIEHFASVQERDAFISGGQLTWIAGSYTPAEIIDAQAETKRYLEQAGREKRIFTADDLAAQVAQYSAIRHIAGDKQQALATRLENAFLFHQIAIDSISGKPTKEIQDKLGLKLEYESGPYLSDLSMSPPGFGNSISLPGLTRGTVRQVVVLDEEDNPSFYFSGKVGTSKWQAVTASSGGFRYEGYDYNKAGRAAPRSIYTPLAMLESYMEIAKTNPEAMQAYKLKILHEYFEVSGDSKSHRQEAEEVVDIINKYDALAFKMWRERQAAKAKAEKQKPASETKTYKAEMKKLGYELLEEIGGHEVLVFKAKDAQDRIVAVKIIRNPEVTAYQSAGEAEIQNIITQLKDAPVNVEKVMNIGKISIDQGKQLTYLVTEYIEGQSLDKYFSSLNNPADFNEVMRLAGGLIDGYNFLKNAGLKVSPVVLNRVILSTQTKEPIITYYLFTERHAQYEQVAIADTLLEMVTGVNPLSMKDKERYVQDVQAIVSEITQPRYGEGSLATGLAEIFKSYLNKEAGYTLAADIYQHLRRLQRAQNQTFYASWGEFEQKELFGKAISQQARNLSQPQRIAFNLDSFAVDQNVTLFGGVNRIIDNIFRLLEGNPNFVPAAVFLGDYAESMPSSFERLAEFLNSNPALGNSKYSVKLQGENLVINGRAIPLYKGLATPEKLSELGVEFLIEATRQRYLDSMVSEAEKDALKQKEEEAQAGRIEDYLSRLNGLKVIVVSPEEDKGEALTADPIVNRVNTTTALKPTGRKVVLAEPVKAVREILIKVVDDVVKAQNEKAGIRVIKSEAIRTDRQGNGLINVTSRNPREDFASLVTDTAVMPGANAVKVILRIDGFMKDLSYEKINAAFRQAAKGALKGLIDYKGEPTASSFETFNQHPLIFNPIKADDLKEVRPVDGAPYRTVALTGFYSEAGHAKQALDLMTEMSMFEGNQATVHEAASMKAPYGTIPRTADKIRAQHVEDGAPISVAVTAPGGRISVNGWLRLWDDPNFNIVFVNAVRQGAEKITADRLEFDQVFGPAPFTVDETPDKKNFKIADREERVIVLNRPSGGTLENIATPYGNLFVGQRVSMGITELKLHGEDVLNLKVTDNQDGTLSAQGKLRNGTVVRVTYLNDGANLINFVSVGIKKQIIIPLGHVRADKSIYSQQKGESPEDFLSRIKEGNSKVARQIIAEFDGFNEDVIVMETSGQLTESTKLQPFYRAGAGSGIISAPAKTKIPGATAADATVVPGVNNELFLSAWDILQTASAASCTTNAAAVGAKALLNIVGITSGYFDTIHALTNSQARQFGEILKTIVDSVDARGNIVYKTTGASTELGKAITEMLNTVSGVSLRVGNDDGSLVNYDLQVVPREGKIIPSAEEINEKIKKISETPEMEGGLKGFLGYQAHKTSLEIIGSEFAGIFDPSLTHVNPKTGTVSVSIWYDNERGYTNQYVNLILLKGLHQREIKKKIGIAAQNVVAEPGAYTGRISVESAKENSATSIVAGLGSFRAFEEEANRDREKPVDVNAEVNKTLKKALELGIETPIFNIYVSQSDKARGRANDAINRQVSEGLKDIAPEDIMRITVALQAGDENDASVGSYLETIRKVISGHAAKFFIDSTQREVEEVRRKSGEDGYAAYIANLRHQARGNTELETVTNYSNLLGAIVASKTRVILKLEDAQRSDTDLAKLAGQLNIDGIILSSRFSSAHVKSAISLINHEIAKNYDKRLEMQKRAKPRFLIGISSGSRILDWQDIEALSSGVNSHNIQLIALPAVTQISEFSARQNGEKVAKAALPPADKVPVRILVQNVTLERDKEGFVNLDDFIANYGGHDVLIDHSEQIELTGISDAEAAQIAKRVHELRKEEKITGTAIMAVGETATDRDTGRSMQVVSEQVVNRLAPLTGEKVAETIIAYEPRWAIGTRAAEPYEIQQMHQAIRNAIKDKYGVEVSKRVRIIYGGSLTSQNAEAIFRQKDVNGGLIGGASVSAEEFLKIVKIAERLADSKNASGSDFYMKMYIAGNQKAYPLKSTHAEIVNGAVGVDRRKVDIALGPELSKIHQLASVYTKDPLEGIVFIDQLFPEEIYGKYVFDRVDFNINLDDMHAQPNNPDTWKILEDLRIRRALETVKYSMKNGGITVVMTHFEPKGQNVKDPQSVNFLVPFLEQYLNTKVTFVSDILGSGRLNALKNAKPGDVIFFENVRLDPKVRALEKSKNPADWDKLAALLYAGPNPKNPTAGVIRINDAFGAAHREHASIVGKVAGVPMLGGLLLRDELLHGSEVIKNPPHPMVFLLGGGSKINEKIPMLKNVALNKMQKGDLLVIQGGAIIPFLMVTDPGFEPGLSRNLADQATLEAAAEIVELAEAQGVKLMILAKDLVVADHLPADEAERVQTEIVARHNVPASKAIYDIGPQAVEDFMQEIFDEKGQSRYKFFFENGPAGVFEHEQFRQGTQGVHDAIAEATEKGAVSYFGGGDTAYSAEVTGVTDRISFISTGGGASLKVAEGVELPGAEVLRGSGGIYAYHLNANIEAAYENIRGKLSDYAAGNVQAPLTSSLPYASNYQLGESALKLAEDTDNQKVILIDAASLRSDPSLIFALQSINLQINQRAGNSVSDALVGQVNSFRPVLIADEPVEGLFNLITEVTGVKAHKEMFAHVITQADMYEGNISNPADLLKQLDRVGVKRDLILGLLGEEDWVAALKRQQGVSENTLGVIAQAKNENEIAFAGKGLFALVELIAAENKQQAAGDLEAGLGIQQSGADNTIFEVKPVGIVGEVSEAIKHYRERASKV